MTDSKHISWFKDIGLADRPHVGGKGGSLGELQRAGIDVPPGFVVRTATFERFVEFLEQQAPVRAEVEPLESGDLISIGRVSARLRERFEQTRLPPDITAELIHAHEMLSGDTGAAVAVRSSATTEDAADASFAGLQDTFLWVTTADDVLKLIRRCWSSLYSVESISYRRKLSIPEEGVAMAVVVQRMVNARTAGVMFTRSPTTGDRSVITIEGAWGLGSAVVGGEVTPDRWVVGKITGEVSSRDVSDKATEHLPAAGGGVDHVPVPEERRRTACLSDEELQVLRSVARKVERHYGCAQDIEWAIDRDSNSLFLLQSRPETVWSSKDPAPAAKAVADPAMHVMSIFGGKR